MLAFLIPISIFLLAMYLMDIYPFGNTSMRVIDAISQYPAFFEGLKDGDLFTFKIGLGTNFYTTWTTYLASPLSFLYFFFENYQFDLFFVILVLLKIGLIGLNMNILLNYKKERNKYSLIFSTIYALSGFVSLYYFNYQFLDALYMLPLIMIGIEKIVNENKNLMYFITLTLMIIFHYYTAYMICIFSVIYFFFLLVNSELEKKDKRKRIIKFFITSLFCGLCSSFITIPSIYGLLQGRSSWYNGLEYLSFNKNILSFFYDLTAGSTYGNDIMYGAAPLFMTLFVIVLIIFIFFNKKNTKKYKISLLIIFFIFFVSLGFNLLYYGWHVFQRPTYYPGRFVFCFVCFFVLISYKNFLNISSLDFNLRKRIIIVLLFCIFVVMSFVFKINYSQGFIFDKRFAILLIFNLLIFIYYIFCINNKKLLSLTIFLIFLEILINLICSFNSLLAHSNYYNLTVSEFKDYVKDINQEFSSINDSNFVRADFNDNYTMNSGFVYNYNGISYFNSMFNNNLLTFGDNSIIYGEKNNHIAYYNGDFLLDSFLGLKYRFRLNNDNLAYIENDYVIESIGVMVPYNEVLKTSNISDSYNYFGLNSNYKIIKDYLEPEVILENLKLEENKWTIIDETKNGKVSLRYKVLYDSLGYIETNNFNMLVDFEKNIFENYSNIIKLYLNGEEVQEILYLKTGDIVTLEININKKIGFVKSDIWDMFIVDKAEYEKYINYLNNNNIENIKLNTFGFTGNLQVNNDKTLLLLTIPFDEGIEVYANGKQQKVEKYLNGITGIQLPEGNYKIEFIYRVKGLKLGTIISIISLVTFILLKTLEKIIICRYNKNDNKEEIYK